MAAGQGALRRLRSAGRRCRRVTLFAQGRAATCPGYAGRAARGRRGAASALAVPRRLQEDPPAGVSGAPSENNIMVWNAVIFG